MVLYFPLFIWNFTLKFGFFHSDHKKNAYAHSQRNVWFQKNIQTQTYFDTDEKMLKKSVTRMRSMSVSNKITVNTTGNAVFFSFFCHDSDFLITFYTNTKLCSYRMNTMLTLAFFLWVLHFFVWSYFMCCAQIEA